MRKILSFILLLFLLVGNAGISFGASKQFGPYDYDPKQNYDGMSGLIDFDLHFSQNWDSFIFKGKKNGKWYVIKNGKVVSDGYDDMYFLRYSPDGKSFAFDGEIAGKWHVIKDGKIVSDGYDNENFNDISYPLYSPDGKSFAFVGTKNTGTNKISYVIKDGVVASEGYYPISSLIFSPDGTSFSFVGGVDIIKDGKVVGKRKVIIKDGKNISDKYENAYSPTYSSDGKSFAYIADSHLDRTTYIIKDGQIVNGGDVDSPAFSPDGKSFFYTGRKDSKYVLVKDGRIVDVSSMDNRRIIYSPDGNSFAFVVEDLNSTIQSKILKDGQFISEGYKNAYLPTYSPDGNSFAYVGEKDGKWYVIKDGKNIGEGYSPTYSSDGKYFVYIHQEADWKWYITVQSLDNSTKVNTNQISGINYNTTTPKGNLKIITEKQRLSLEKQMSGFSIEKTNQILSKTDIMLSKVDLPEKNRKIFEDLKIILNERLDILRPKLDVAGQGSLGGGGGDSVICTELTRQKYLPQEIWQADGLFAEKYVSKGTLDVYHFWAKPLVQLMRQSYFVTEIVSPYGTAWANHMAYEMGVIQKDNWLGYYLTNTLLPIHEKISNIFVPNNDIKVVQMKASTTSPSFIEIMQVIALYLLLLLLIVLPIVSLYIVIVLIRSFLRTVKKFLVNRIDSRKTFAKLRSQTIQ